MDKILYKLGEFGDWLFSPTTISWLQENGEGTISRFGVMFCACVLVGVVAVIVNPKLRTKFF